LTGAVPTIAHRLRAAGYATILVGKYHLGFPLIPRGGARRAAFGGGGRGLTHAELVSAVSRYAGFETVEALWGGNRQTAATPHHPEYMAARAAAAMRKAKKESRQWFVYFAPTVPHAPFSLPHSLLANTSLTPQGVVAADPRWRESRDALLARCRNRSCFGPVSPPPPWTPPQPTLFPFPLPQPVPAPVTLDHI
jgi:arylsulfatase A-like enzyme